MSKDKSPEIADSMLALLLFVVLLGIEPWIVCQLWRWFVVPLGLPSLRWSQAFGLNLIVNVIVYRWPGARTSNEQLKAAAHTFATAVMALALGYLVFKLSA